ncbi:MAG: biotin transporter BioY [Longimicrobiales bacterium]
MRHELTNTELRTEAVQYRTMRRVLAIVLFAILTAVGAALEVKLPGTPVPITLQTLFVSLSGALLGPFHGAASQALYLLVGAMGAPVFSGGDAGVAVLIGPTGGYLLAFPIAAAITGRLAGPVAQRITFGGAARLGVAIFLGTVAVFVGGAAQLTLLTGDLRLALTSGVLPFVIGDLVKVAGALAIALRYRTRTLAQL